MNAYNMTEMTMIYNAETDVQTIACIQRAIFDSPVYAQYARFMIGIF